MMISYQYQLSSICYVDVKGTNVLIPCSIQVVGNTATRTQWRKVFGVAGNGESERVKTPMVCGCGGVSLRFVHPFFHLFFNAWLPQRWIKRADHRCFGLGLPSWRHNLVILHRVHVERGKKHLLDRLIRWIRKCICHQLCILSLNWNSSHSSHC